MSGDFIWGFLGRLGTYSYGAIGSGKPAYAPQTIAGATLQYDANGNMSSDGVTTLVFDVENRPISVGGIASTYNPDGERTSVGTVSFTHDLSEYDSATGITTNYYLFGESRVASNANQQLTFYHGDHLNSASTMTNINGGVIGRQVLSPFGRKLSTGGYTGPIGLAGQRLDITGLYHMGAREMNPSLGIFVTADPSGAPDPEKPQTLSRYAYANNSPTNLVDPTGYKSVTAQLEEAESNCGSVACSIGMRYAKVGYHVATLGFASIHDPMLDAYDRGEATGEEYIRVGIAGGAAAAVTSWFGGQWIGEGGGALIGRYGPGASKFVKGLFSESGGAKGVASSVAKESDEAFHFTFEKSVSSIEANGLRPGSYATPSGNLSPLQAQIDLALPPNRGLPNAMLKIDLQGMRTAGFEIPQASQASRNFGMPGGGVEMKFPYTVPPQFISVVKK